MAALATEHCIGTAAHGSSGISGWEQESDHRLNGQIVEVISYKRGMLDAHLHLLLWDVRVAGLSLIPTRQWLIASSGPTPPSPFPVLHLERRSEAQPVAGCRRRIPRPSRTSRCLLSCTSGVESEAAIGGHTVYIQQEQLDRSQVAPQQAPTRPSPSIMTGLAVFRSIV